MRVKATFIPATAVNRGVEWEWNWQIKMIGIEDREVPLNGGILLPSKYTGNRGFSGIGKGMTLACETAIVSDLFVRHLLPVTCLKKCIK